jgi:hypothetical protein
VDKLGPKLGPYAITVYNVLCREARDNQVAGLATATIAARIGCGRTKVFEALQVLEKYRAIARRSIHGQETTYVLLELKTDPPVQDTDGSDSTARTGGVHNTDGTRSRGERPNKEAKTQDCKTVLPPTPLSEGGDTNLDRTQERNLPIADTMPESTPLMSTKVGEVFETLIDELQKVSVSAPCSLFDRGLDGDAARHFRHAVPVRLLGTVVELESDTPGLTQEGCQKYARRIADISKRVCGVPLSFLVRPSVNRTEHRTPVARADPNAASPFAAAFSRSNQL